MFIVTNACGERIASFPNIEEATRLMRVLPIASEVVRECDGVVMAFKRFGRRAPELLVNVAMRGAA